MTSTTIRGMMMHYDRLGSGEPLVLIHGLGEQKEGWLCQYPLSKKYDLIIPDLRGHGKSFCIDDISIESFAKDVLTMLDHLNIMSAHICGISMGGVVSQEIYRQAPKRCKSLTLVSTFHYAPKSLGEIVYQIRKWRAEHLTKEERIQLAAQTCLYPWDGDIMDLFLNVYSPNQEAYMKSVESCLKVDYQDMLPHIKVPTLIIGGQYDVITPVWCQILMHKSIPGSELFIFRNTGHISKMEKPAKFNHLVSSFINRTKTLRATS